MGANSRTGRALPSSLARNILLADARATAAVYHMVPACAQETFSGCSQHALQALQPRLLTAPCGYYYMIVSTA